MRKKLLSILLILFLTSFLAACGGAATEAPADPADEPAATEAPAEEPADEPAEEPADEPAEEPAEEAAADDALLVGQVTDAGGINDASFNELAWQGLQDAELDFGAEIKFLESAQQTDYEKNINEFIQQDYDLIVTVGFLLGDATQAAAEANPDVNFAIIDVDYLSAPNILQSVFSVDEASFLAGYLAAGTTETGKVGTFGGVNIPPVVQFMVGFENGVNYYNEQKGTNVEVLGWSNEARDGLFTGNFESLDDGRAFAESLFDEGADIILPVAGPVGQGSAAAAADRGLMMIGVDQDWYFSAPNFAPVYLTSILKRVDLVPYRGTEMVVNGNFEGGVMEFTLENGGVELSDYHDNADKVSAELQSELDAIEEAIIAGELSTGWMEYMGTEAPPADDGAEETSDAGDSEMLAMEWPAAPADSGEFAGVDPTGETVTWWHNHSGSREEALLEMIAEFNNENPYDITVEPVNQGSYGDIREQMGAAAVSGETPDIVVGYQNDQAFYASIDLLVDMDRYVNDSYWGLSEEQKADFAQGIYFQDVHPAFDDARLGFPPNRSMEVLYLNKTWMEELGYDPEATITPELFEEVACAAAEDRGDGEGGYIISFDASQVAAAALARGGNVLSEDGLSYNYDSPELQAYFEQIKGMYDSGCAWVSPERFHDAEFASRQGIFYFGSTSGLPFAQGSMEELGNDDDWGIAAVPYTTDTPRQNMYGGSVMMPLSSPEKELAAWIFINWFTSPSAQADWVRASNYFSPRLSVGNQVDDYIAENPKYGDALELLPYASFEPQLISYADVRNEVSEAFQEIINADANIAETLSELDATADALQEEAAIQ